MKIKKVLNQNAVLLIDGSNEKVAIGKGIGFNKKKNDLIHEHDIEQMFVVEKEQEKLQQLLSQIDEAYFFASEQIIEYAERFLKEKLNEHIHIALADHIAFSVERLQDGIIIQNKLCKEIEILHPEEFMIAEWAIEYLHQQFNLLFPIDEAAYIAIHIHSSRMGQIGNNKSIREITMISEMVAVIAKELNIHFSEPGMELTYARLVTHLRFVLDRFQKEKYHTMDQEVLALVKRKYTESHRVVSKVAEMLKQDYRIDLPEDELGYIVIHVERLNSQIKKQENEGL